MKKIKPLNQQTKDRIGIFISNRLGLISVLIVLIYLLLKYVFFILKNHYGNDHMISIVIIDSFNVLSNGVVVTGLSGLIIYLVRDQIITWIRGYGTIRTLHFTDLESCIKLLSEQINIYSHETSRAHITTLTPFMFSPAYIDHVFSDDQIGSVAYLEHKSQILKIKDYLQKYTDVFSAIVQSSDGAYDKTIIGKTSVPVIDQASYAYIKSAYEMDTDLPPGTTEISYHSNITEYTILIFSEFNPEFESEPSKFKFMMFIHYANHFKNLCCYICFDEPTIKNIYEFIQFRRSDVEASIVSNSANTPSTQEWKQFKQDIEQFLTSH